MLNRRCLTEFQHEPLTAPRLPRAWRLRLVRDKIKKMELRVAKFRTHEEAEEADLAYYRSLTPEQRLEILFQLREMYLKDFDASSQRMARVYRITQLPRS